MGDNSEEALGFIDLKIDGISSSVSNMLIAHTTLLEISCPDSYMYAEIFCMIFD